MFCHHILTSAHEAASAEEIFGLTYALLNELCLSAHDVPASDSHCDAVLPNNVASDRAMC